MNTPSEHDLRPSTRERQRDELIAIVGHESHEGTPRRRVVPLVAAAAVLALTAGLAVGIPVLRDQNRGLPVNGSVKKQTDVEELNAADKARFGAACGKLLELRSGPKSTAPQPVAYEVLDGFRFPYAKASTHTPVWVVVKSKSEWITCGIDKLGKIRQQLFLGEDQTLYQPVNNLWLTGGGVYDKSIARITVKVGTRPPLDAVLRNGYFFAPVPYVRVRGPHSDSTAIPTVLQGYDAAGKLVYTSPRTDGEFHARRKACYVDPNGKLVAWMSNNPHPDLKTCRKSIIWNYLPR
jgi:hypothetical protein